MPPFRTHHPQQRPSRWLAALLVFALLALQALGQAHRSLHAPPGAHAHAAAAGPALGHEHGAQASPALFGHEQQSGECRLFDQLLLADLAFDGVAPSQALPAAGGAEQGAATAPAGAARLAYRARAPPAIFA